MGNSITPDNMAQNLSSGTLDIDAKIADALSKISVCARSVSLYGRHHPTIHDLVQAAHQSLAELLLSRPTLSVAVTESYLALESFPIEDSAGSLAGFARLLHERGVSELSVRGGVAEAEVSEFAEALSFPPNDLQLRGGLPMEMRKRKITNIAIREGVAPAESREGKDPADIYEDALVLVDEALKAVQAGLQIPTGEIRAVVADSLHSLIADESALLALAGIRTYDRYLMEHSVNVCILSMVMGRDVGLDPAATLELGIAAMLHDVGKVFVPGAVVKKPGKLSEEEWEQMRKHPAEGARALAGLPDLPSLAATIAMEHHIHCDGTGYPLVGTEYRPHLLSRLVAIVDTYDALTTDRPYRERWTAQMSIGWMLYEAWGQYDRQLMARFASRAGLYPIGALVRLVNGEMAIISGGSHKHADRPTLKVIVGSAIQSPNGKTIDLLTNRDPGLEIDKVAQPVEVLLPYSDRLIAA